VSAVAYVRVLLLRRFEEASFFERHSEPARRSAMNDIFGPQYQNSPTFQVISAIYDIIPNENDCHCFFGDFASSQACVVIYKS
jgi:hypothetical protein